MVKCKECGKEFEQKKSLRSHYIGKKDHDYDKEEFNNTYEEEGAGGSSGSPNSGQDKSDNSQEESIDRDDLKDKLEEMLGPYSGDDLEAYPVSTMVNNPRNDVEECVERWCRIVE